MTPTGVHRLLERLATTRGEVPAIIERTRTLTFRDLNQRANMVARHLIAAGFRRGTVASVRMDKSADTVVVLLAILKAGGAYTWVPSPEGEAGRCVSFEAGQGTGVQQVAVDVSEALQAPPVHGPNLPLLTRASDVACVISQGDGAPGVLVPHETITSLSLTRVPTGARWSDEPGALDLWVALLAGVTVSLVPEPRHFAAA